MKTNNPLRIARILIAVGLLMVVLPTVIKDFSVTVPDFFRGLSLGLGLGLEVIGLVIQKKAGGLKRRSIFSDTHQ
jgi:hypothetical protein